MRVATFNLFQYCPPPHAWFDKENVHSNTAWKEKSKWIQSQLELMSADVVIFQEVFDTKSLTELVKEAGYEYCVNIDQPKYNETDGVKVFYTSVLLLASKHEIELIREPIFPVKSKSPFVTFPRISREPIVVKISTPSLNVLLCGVHFKSKRLQRVSPDFKEGMVFEGRRLDRLKGQEKSKMASFFQRALESMAIQKHLKRIMRKEKFSSVILLGDFNDTPSSDFWSAFTMGRSILWRDEDEFKIAPFTKEGDIALKDSWEEFGGVASEKPPTLLAPAPLVLDHILVRNESDCVVSDYQVYSDHLRSGVDWLKVSDHATVCMELSKQIETN